MNQSMGRKVVVVTGANSGIGFATTVRLARSGYSVVGTVRSKEKGCVLVEACSRLGLEIEQLILDVRDPGAPHRIAECNPYALINNAGYSNFGAVEDISDQSAAEQIDVMLLSPMRLSRAVLPGMLSRGNGRIVFVSSIFGFITVPFNAWYQASKHGLEAAADALRVEVATRNVGVSIIEPGAVKTELWNDHDNVLARHPDSRHIQAYRRSLKFMERYQPIMTSSDHVARAIETSVSHPRPKSRYLVGVDARALSALKIVLPHSILDGVTRSVLGL